MSKFTPAQRKDLAALLAPPARYRELKPVLEAYMGKTVYRQRHSFERALREDGLLHHVNLRAQNGRTTNLYSSVPAANWNPYQVAQALAPTGYFCNLTSIFYHSLTNQVPAKIFVATEGNRAKDQPLGGRPELTDDDIFQAFILPHRMTRHVVTFHDREIVISERVARSELGVGPVHADNRICPKGSKVTCLERALIDAVVLPQYNGGIRAAIDAFRKAHPRVNRRLLLELYDGMAYGYPYWQALGFLFDRLGAHSLARFIGQRYPLKHKFYLDHGAKTSWVFDEKWRIYYPKGVI